MDVTHIFNLFLLFGGVVTVLMATLLWFYVENISANRVLAVLILVWGATVFAFVAQSKSFFQNYPHTLGLGTSLNLLYFPLVYLYIKTFLNIEARNSKFLAIHFLPFVLYLVVLSPFFFMDISKKLEYIISGNLPQWIVYLFDTADIVAICQGLIYTVLSVRTIHWYQYFRNNKTTPIEDRTISWLTQFIILNSILWVFGTTSVFIEMAIPKLPFDLFKVFYFGVTILIYWMGFLTIKRTRFFSFGEIQRIHHKVEESILDIEPVENKSKEIVPKSGKETIVDLMEKEKPYLKSDMSLQDIVSNTSLSKVQVSEILNDDLGQSFYDFISEYRTKEVIKLIGEGKTKDYTLLHIAEMAGFNSKATFYRTFKKHTGKTPKEYVNLFKR